MNVQEYNEQIKKLEEEEEKINKKINELDRNGKFMESIILLPKVFEISNEIKRLQNELMFIKGPTYKDESIDLYYIENKSNEDKYYYYDIYLSKTKTNIGYIVYRNNNSIVRIGDIGYLIEEQYRHHSYAYKALNLISKKIEELDKEKIIITTTIENIPSIKTIEKFGGNLIEKDKYNVLYFECKIKNKNKTR